MQTAEVSAVPQRSGLRLRYRLKFRGLLRSCRFRRNKAGYVEISV